MTSKVEEARRLLVKVPFPDMTLAANGEIVAQDGRVVCTMNLVDLSLTEAFTFATAFIAAAEAIMLESNPRALIRRAHDAMSRRDPDGISTEAWDQLVVDMAKELGVGNG